MTLLTMFDSVTVDHIPADAKYIALYVDGQYENLAAGKARCPHAAVLTITVNGGDADCCDCETGDLTVSQAEVWVGGQLAKGRFRPCVYANASTWAGELGAALVKYGPRIRRWVAAYPGTGANVPEGFDAHQYSGGGALDTSVCLVDFFAVKPVPPAKPHGVARVELELDVKNLNVAHRPMPGLVKWGTNEQWIKFTGELCVGGAQHGDWVFTVDPKPSPKP